VKNLALIEEAEVFFEPGLNILTGETGAGKSIILGSINLALGEKIELVEKSQGGKGRANTQIHASQSQGEQTYAGQTQVSGQPRRGIIRSGAEYATVSLTFVIDRPEQRAAVAAMDLPLGEDGILVISRRIMPNRSVMKINGESVSAAEVRTLAAALLDIHGQHERHSLLKVANHREILDDLGQKDELFALKDSLRTSVREYNELCRELNHESTSESARQREIKLLEHEINEIEQAALIIGEDEQCEKDWRKMANAGKLREVLGNTHNVTGYDSEASAGAAIGRVLKEVMSVTGDDEELSNLAAQLSDIDTLLNDFNHSVTAYMAGLEFDERTLIATESRLNQLNHLKTKYHTDIAGILTLKEEKESRLTILLDYENYRAGLEERCEGKKAQVLDICREISLLRTQTGKTLALQMQTALRELSFADVRFEVTVTPDEESFSADGYDQVTFMIAPNLGEELRSLHQVASGGELSRVMLALKTIKAGIESKGTLLFDEIDAGISGKTAWKIAERLAALTAAHQVICITHLPQIAAMADTHFAIRKEVKNERTVTLIDSLDDEESLAELARLLGTEAVTSAVTENAKEMKAAARKVKSEVRE
jgi:DNA repair protein RecN (Recombination protein N)